MNQSGSGTSGSGTTGTGTGTSGTSRSQSGTSTGTSGTMNQSGTGTSGSGTSGTKSSTSGTSRSQSGTSSTGVSGAGTSASQSASQDNKGWTKIGEKTVNITKDKDNAEIDIEGSEKFSSIKLRVDDADMIDLEKVEVEYEGGEKQAVNMDAPLNEKTGESKVIQLDSKERNIKKINFGYKSSESGTGDKDAKDNKANIEVWGMKANTAQR